MNCCYCCVPCSCSLWLLYGLKKPDFSISLVNTVGLLLQLFYVFVYHTYADAKVCKIEKWECSRGMVPEGWSGYLGIHD